MLGASETPIQPVLCGSDAQAHALAGALQQAGWWVDAVPARATGPAHLRVLLSALHSHEQVEHLLDALAFARDGVHGGMQPVTALSA